MLLHFVRHGETDFNAAERLQGRAIDEPLNQTGVQQMAALLPSLPRHFDVIFASRLRRTMMSARLIADATGKEIVLRDEIDERDFGSLAGRRWEDIPNGAALRSMDMALEYDYRPYGGESVGDVEKRLRRFFDELRKSDYSSALVISSNGVIRLAYRLIGDQLVPQIRNATVHTLRLQ